ncbi:hypothetical protein [Chitinophaga sp.]|uniref:hypothetical protein n=1 Tax=Chitinophaga sp. TaxID=1869181 RepID=UPI0031D5CB79
MQKVLKIKNENIARFVNRELKRQLDILKIVFGCLLILFIILGVISRAYFIPLIAIAVFGVVFLYVSAILKGDLKALSTAFTFIIDDNGVSRQVDWSQINSFMKLRAQRASQRYGSSLDQVIEFANVDKISVGVNGIKITSINANILNGNGIINLPVELAFYEDVLDYFKSNPSLYSRIVHG